MDGNRLVSTPYELRFREDKDHAKLCDKALTKKDLASFRKVGHE
jgi:hypothetical protein